MTSSLFGLGRIAGLFYATQAGATCHLGLGFDHHLTTELLCDLIGLLWCSRQTTSGHGDVVLLQEFLALILVQSSHRSSAKCQVRFVIRNLTGSSALHDLAPGLREEGAHQSDAVLRHPPIRCCVE